MITRGIRNLTDQNSLINPDRMMYLKALYSNRSQKNYKMVESDTIKILDNNLTKLRKSRFLRSVSLLLWNLSIIFIENWNKKFGWHSMCHWPRLLSPMAISFHKLVLFLRQVFCNFFKNYLNRTCLNASEAQDLSRSFDLWDTEFL